jgi:hypothetical protein
MTTEKQIAANRRNAESSAGPLTAAGKARSSQNALRHGLSRRGAVSPDCAADILEFALQLVGEAASPIERDLARAAAEAQLNLRHVNAERQRLLESLISETSSPAKRVRNIDQSLQAIVRLVRYESKAQALRKRALNALSRRRGLPVFG